MDVIPRQIKAIFSSLIQEIEAVKSAHARLEAEINEVRAQQNTALYSATCQPVMHGATSGSLGSTVSRFNERLPSHTPSDRTMEGDQSKVVKGPFTKAPPKEDEVGSDGSNHLPKLSRRSGKRKSSDTGSSDLLEFADKEDGHGDSVTADPPLKKRSASGVMHITPSVDQVFHESMSAEVANNVIKGGTRKQRKTSSNGGRAEPASLAPSPSVSSSPRKALTEIQRQTQLLDEVYSPTARTTKPEGHLGLAARLSSPSDNIIVVPRRSTAHNKPKPAGEESPVQEAGQHVLDIIHSVDVESPAKKQRVATTSINTRRLEQQSKTTPPLSLSNTKIDALLELHKKFKVRSGNDRDEAPVVEESQDEVELNTFRRSGRTRQPKMLPEDEVDPRNFTRMGIRLCRHRP